MISTGYTVGYLICCPFGTYFDQSGPLFFQRYGGWANSLDQAYFFINRDRAQERLNEIIRTTNSTFQPGSASSDYQLMTFKQANDFLAVHGMMGS